MMQSVMVVILLVVAEYTVHVVSSSAAESEATKCPLYFGRGDTLLSASHNKTVLNLYLKNAAENMYLDGWASLNVLPGEKRLTQLNDLTDLFNIVRHRGAAIPDYHFFGGRANMAKTWNVPGLKMAMTFTEFLTLINDEYVKVETSAQKDPDNIAKVTENLAGCLDERSEIESKAPKCPLYFGRGDTLFPASHNGQKLNIYLKNAAEDMYLDGWASLNVLPAKRRMTQLKLMKIIFNEVQQDDASVPDNHWVGGRANMAKTWHVAGLKMNMTFTQFLNAINDQYAKAQKSIDNKVDETSDGC